MSETPMPFAAMEAVYNACVIGEQPPNVMIRHGIVYERQANGDVWAWDLEEWLSLTPEQRKAVGRED